jgi:hypothetical protein
MAKSPRGLWGAALLAWALVGPGCTGSNIEEGVPKDTGYVPPKMQPMTLQTKGKPKLEATAKDRAEAKAKEAPGPAGAPTP